MLLSSPPLPPLSPSFSPGAFWCSPAVLPSKITRQKALHEFLSDSFWATWTKWFLGPLFQLSAYSKKSSVLVSVVLFDWSSKAFALEELLDFYFWFFKTICNLRWKVRRLLSRTSSITVIFMDDSKLKRKWFFLLCQFLDTLQFFLKTFHHLSKSVWCFLLDDWAKCFVVRSLLFPSSMMKK